MGNQNKSFGTHFEYKENNIYIRLLTIMDSDLWLLFFLLNLVAEQVKSKMGNR